MAQAMELAKPRSGIPILSAGALSTVSDLAVPLAVLGVVVALITPLPGFVLDLLIVLDIMTSVIVMMVAMYIGRPVEFSVFPTVLFIADALPPGLERILLPANPAKREFRNRRGRTCHRGVR